MSSSLIQKDWHHTTTQGGPSCYPRGARLGIHILDHRTGHGQWPPERLCSGGARAGTRPPLSGERGLPAFLGHWSDGGLSDHTSASAASLCPLSLPPLLHTLASQCRHLHGLQGVTVATPSDQPLHSSSGSSRYPPSALGIPGSGAQSPGSHPLPCPALYSAPPSAPYHPVPQRPCLPRSQSC